MIIADQHVLTTSTVDADGRVEFAPLAVAPGTWTSDSGSIPPSLLCGNTVIAARAFQPGHADIPAYRFLAAAYFVSVTACE